MAKDLEELKEIVNSDVYSNGIAAARNASKEEDRLFYYHSSEVLIPAFLRLATLE